MIKYEKVKNDEHLPIKFIDLDIQGEGLEYIDKHWHNSLEIMLRVTGDSYIFDNGENVWIKGGDVYIFNSQNIHAFDGIPKGMLCSGISIQFNIEFLKQYCPNFENYSFQQPNQKQSLEIKHHMLEIKQWYYSKSPYKDIKIKSSVIAILFILLEYLAYPKEKRTHIKSEKNKYRITKIMNYIDHHYNEDLSIDMLSELSDYSAGHLEKIFRDNLNISIKRYIISVRLKHATDDLLYTDYPIIDIAYQNGFPNVKSFITAFKLEYHMTPSLYRKKMKK